MTRYMHNYILPYRVMRDCLTSSRRQVNVAKQNVNSYCIVFCLDPIRISFKVAWKRANVKLQIPKLNEFHRSRFNLMHIIFLITCIIVQSKFIMIYLVQMPNVGLQKVNFIHVSAFITSNCRSQISRRMRLVYKYVIYKNIVCILQPLHLFLCKGIIQF